MQCFRDVSVGFPAGGRAPGSFDVAGASWVPWTLGEVRVDPGSFGIFVVPQGPQNISAKPMGCLLGANELQGEPGQVIARTSDVIHGLVRLGFTTRQDLEAFMVVARKAEAQHTVYRSRLSNAASPQRQWGTNGSSTEQLVDIIREHCTGTWPLIYTGAELYGPEPCGDGGGEVLLARGAVVLLDPSEMPGVEPCTYDLIFYDEGLNQPTLRVPIGPRMKIAKQVNPHPGRLSAPSRASMCGGDRRSSVGRPPIAEAFDFTVEGVNVSALTFDMDEEAENFLRDVRVRLRLTRATLKAARGLHNLGELQGQLFDLKRHGFFATIFRWAIGFAIVVLIVMIAHGTILYANDDRSVLDITGEVLSDTAVAAEILAGTVRKIGATACEAINGGRSLPATAVEACAAMPYAQDAQACLRELTARLNLS